MKHTHKLGLLALLFTAAGFIACGSDNPEPGDADPIDTPDGSGGSGNATGSGGDTGSGAGGTTFERPDRDPCPEEPDGVQPDSHPAAHRGTPCWDVKDCNIENKLQAANQCNSAGCFPFDNGTIDGYTPGDPLPALDL